MLEDVKLVIRHSHVLRFTCKNTKYMHLLGFCLYNMLFRNVISHNGLRK